MKRPWGVLLVAVLVLFMGGGVLFLEAVDGTMRGLLGEAISLGKWYAVVGVLLFLSLHAAYAVSAVGMLLRQNWARWLLLLSTPAFIVGRLLLNDYANAEATGRMVDGAIKDFIFSGVCLIILTRRGPRAYFSRDRGVTASAAPKDEPITPQ